MAGDGRGIVYLVGAGPGDPGLLTRAARRSWRGPRWWSTTTWPAPACSTWRPASALRICAGKSIGHCTLSQDEINALLVEHAREGRRVVRLKGGDPFVFGRGAEEAEHLPRLGDPGAGRAGGDRRGLAIGGGRDRRGRRPARLLLGHRRGGGSGRRRHRALRVAEHELAELVERVEVAHHRRRPARRLLRLALRHVHPEHVDAPDVARRGRQLQRRLVVHALDVLERDRQLGGPALVLVLALVQRAVDAAPWRSSSSSRRTASASDRSCPRTCAARAGRCRTRCRSARPAARRSSPLPSASIMISSASSVHSLSSRLSSFAQTSVSAFSKPT